MAQQVKPRPQYKSNLPDEKPRKKPARTTQIRRTSVQRGRLNAVVNPGKRGFLTLAGKCMKCRKRKPDEVHEICRGNAREACLLHPELWLALCRICHDELDDTHTWPVERQIALRSQWDDEVRVFAANDIMGTAQTHITMKGVDEWR